MDRIRNTAPDDNDHLDNDHLNDDTLDENNVGDDVDDIFDNENFVFQLSYPNWLADLWMLTNNLELCNTSSSS